MSEICFSPACGVVLAEGFGFCGGPKCRMVTSLFRFALDRELFCVKCRTVTSSPKLVCVTVAALWAGDRFAGAL